MNLGGTIDFKKKDVFQWISKEKDGACVVVNSDNLEFLLKLNQECFEEFRAMMNEFHEKGSTSDKEKAQGVKGGVQLDAFVDLHGGKVSARLDTNVDGNDFHELVFKDSIGNEFFLVMDDIQVVGLHSILEKFIIAQSTLDELDESVGLSAGVSVAAL